MMSLILLDYDQDGDYLPRPVPRWHYLLIALACVALAVACLLRLT